MTSVASFVVAFATALAGLAAAVASFPGPRYTWGPIYGSACPSVTKSQSLVDLTDVSPVDEDANSILADDTNRAIPGNLEMQVAPPGDQI